MRTAENVKTLHWLRLQASEVLQCVKVSDGLPTMDFLRGYPAESSHNSDSSPMHGFRTSPDAVGLTRAGMSLNASETSEHCKTLVRPGQVRLHDVAHVLHPTPSA